MLDHYTKVILLDFIRNGVEPYFLVKLYEKLSEVFDMCDYSEEIIYRIIGDGTNSYDIFERMNIYKTIVSIYDKNDEFIKLILIALQFPKVKTRKRSHKFKKGGTQ